MKYNWGYAHAKRFVLTEGLDVFRRECIPTTVRMITPGNLYFVGGKKKLWLDECLGVEPRRDGIGLAGSVCKFGVGGYFG
jgi:hypothetical protein